MTAQGIKLVFISCPTTVNAKSPHKITRSVRPKGVTTPKYLCKTSTTSLFVSEGAVGCKVCRILAPVPLPGVSPEIRPQTRKTHPGLLGSFHLFYERPGSLLPCCGQVVVSLQQASFSPLQFCWLHWTPLKSFMCNGIAP